jgi:hypothetical protein
VVLRSREAPLGHRIPMRDRTECQIILALEGMKKTALGHPGFIADVFHGGGGIPFCTNHLQSRIKQLGLRVMSRDSGHAIWRQTRSLARVRPIKGVHCKRCLECRSRDSHKLIA